MGMALNIMRKPHYQCITVQGTGQNCYQGVVVVTATFKRMKLHLFPEVSDSQPCEKYMLEVI
jgi:hypothetical protein